MNHQALLSKFILYVSYAEGIDFILEGDQRHTADVEFSDEEWAELERLARGAKVTRQAVNLLAAREER